MGIQSLHEKNSTTVRNSSTKNIKCYIILLQIMTILFHLQQKQI